MSTELNSMVGMAVVLLLAGCIAGSPPPGVLAGTPGGASTAGRAISQRLYFGRSIPGGGSVSGVDWDVFLAEVVTPRFPGGFTVWRAEGQWLGEDGETVRESSFVLEVVHPPMESAEVAVGEIVREYRRRFRQEAVLRVRDQVNMVIEGS